MQITTPNFLKLGLLGIFVITGSWVWAHNAENHNVRSELMAPGWGELSYVPPAPGTYSLPVIKHAPNGQLLKSDSSSVSLYDLMGDRFVILSFIYTQCGDANGCPLANAVLYSVQNAINDNSALQDSVRMLSVSFDPKHDNPNIMADLTKLFKRGDCEWDFLTAENEQAIQPILQGYGQFVMREMDEHGEDTDRIAHMLRVYLIDKQKQIRNIYSVSFLHPDILLNDLETLVLESVDH